VDALLSKGKEFLSGLFHEPGQFLLCGLELLSQG
jgi:hypothetical protein